MGSLKNLKTDLHRSCVYFPSFAITSGLKQLVVATRSLKFHDESTNTKIKKRYCAVWNEDINGGGAWDTVGVKEIYSDDTVATCFATR